MVRLKWEHDVARIVTFCNFLSFYCLVVFSGYHFETDLQTVAVYDTKNGLGTVKYVTGYIKMVAKLKTVKEHPVVQFSSRTYILHLV